MTNLERLKKANDDYHEAVNSILMDEAPDVNGKVSFASIAHSIFKRMVNANEQAGSCYE